MKKVVCDFCGTSYPETEEFCPTCGSEKSADVEFMEFAEEESPEVLAHEPVKGGRFSKGNVSKRNKSAGKKKAPKNEPSEEPVKGKKKSDRGLVIAVILLLIGVILAGYYIYSSYFMLEKQPQQTDPTKNTQQTNPTDTTPPTIPTTTESLDTKPVDLSCVGLTLSETSIVLNEAGNSWLLNAVPNPANTTDSITYISGDTAVVTVDAEGKVVAVGNGETVITVTCGAVSVTCTVKCDLAPPMETEPTETEPEGTDPEGTQPEETKPDESKPDETKPQTDTDFKLRKSDITFDAKGQTYQLYNGDIDVTEIKWRTGNSKVATITDGKVKAVGPGITTVYGEYNGVEVSCIIRCSF